MRAYNLQSNTNHPYQKAQFSKTLDVKMPHTPSSTTRNTIFWHNCVQSLAKTHVKALQPLEASRGGMKVGRIKDPLYQDSYPLCLVHAPARPVKSAKSAGNTHNQPQKPLARRWRSRAICGQPDGKGDVHSHLGHFDTKHRETQRHYFDPQAEMTKASRRGNGCRLYIPGLSSSVPAPCLRIPSRNISQTSWVGLHIV